MNKISFKGSDPIIRDIVSRFLGMTGEPSPNSAAVAARYAGSLQDISKENSIEPGTLELLIDFLIAHGVKRTRLDRLTGERMDELVQLAHDVETLRRYRRDGTITDVRVVDEWPF